MRARSYLPELGRFLGEDRYEDPQGDQALETDALTQDRYLFAGGNPVDNIEFDGHRVCNGSHDCGGSSKQASRRNSNSENQKSVLSPSEQIDWNRAVNEGGREARGRSERNRRVAAIAPLRPGALLPSCTPGACEPDEDNSILGFGAAAWDAAARIRHGAFSELVGTGTGLWETAKVCSVSTGAGASQIDPACGSLPSPGELERHYLRGDPFEAGGRMAIGVAAVALTRRPSLGAAQGAGAVERTLVIGRTKDLTAPRRAPSRGVHAPESTEAGSGFAEANWKRNSTVLRQELRNGVTRIRDASPGDRAGQFLNAEKNLLENRGWLFDAGSWRPR